MPEGLSRQAVFQGQVLDVGLEEHLLPDGRHATFEIIRHPGGAAVLPLLDDGRVVLIRQFRPAAGRMIYEIPAGRLEPGEPAEACAARELIEEAGYEAATLAPLGGFWSTVGFCDEYIHLFLGRGLKAVQRCLEPDEFIELCPMPLDDAMQQVASGGIADSKTQLALLRYRLLHEDGYR